ncbi:TPA: hypothetical protein SLU74_003248 [Pseudomonas aeruginosa]|uniref:hypothetical protein n=1 Tax=Pseudomonas aeruginosa TaxID=287 RepID=UPI00079C0EB1|nr:hypothetical protein [Pseudomonas aeruginosa]KXG13957.1 hypothetical protein LT17_04713 [Pseudomonas aeruginosa]MBA4941618.1 hypothetical protein [Pseudomonas aeruginosa]MBF2899173.1 hypothetical protein [Pseudomonas aeruginosa]MBF3038837.1 hypothetical protein [Pseudomonas aeruginosa]MBF3203252.1 hypothetical protein [Pseudomonas aeruginosa]
MNSLRHLLSLLVLSADERALLQNLRRLSQADQSFIRRGVQALVQCPAIPKGEKA